MKTINLDQLKQARLEVQGAQIEIVFNGKSYLMPTEIPLSMLKLIDSLNRGEAAAFDEFLAFPFGEDAKEVEKTITDKDINALAESIFSTQVDEVGKLQG